MKVLKFGGAALADYQNIKNCKDYIKYLVKNESGDLIVVVSAMKDVTDLLINTLDLAVEDNQENVLRNLFTVQTKFETVVDNLIQSLSIKSNLKEFISKTILEMNSILKSITILREYTPKMYDNFIVYGEKISSTLVAHTLTDYEIPAQQVNGEDLIVTDNNFNFAYPDLKLSTAKIQNVLPGLLNEGVIPVVTGFVGANLKGEITTLGRGGTDFSASIMAYGMDADEAWFLKEVDGIMTADPQIVKNAVNIRSMTYSEVSELSYFGAKVLHPIAIHPLKEKKIHSYVKNVYEFDSAGTCITNSQMENGKTTRAITYIKSVSIVNIQGQGMIGVPGVAGRVFTATGAENINILMISQSSSEQNISFVIGKGEMKKTLEVLNAEFELEILKGQIDEITAENSLSIISVVGAGMKNTPGISGNLFSALGENNINVKLIAQGSSELNISFVIETEFLENALNCIHNKFHLNN